jgi:thiol-disulfide isomerase/thioredoxin
MNTIHKFTFSLKPIIITGICFLSLSCAKIKHDEFPEPVIESGIARLSGKITNFQQKQGESGPILKLYVPNPVTAEPGIYETNLNDDGSFHFDVPVECDITICTLVSAIFDRVISVSLTTKNETKLELIYDESGNIKANAGDINILTSEDMEHIVEVMGKMISHVSPERIPRYNMLIEDFIPFEIKSLERKLDIARNDTILSNSAKKYITNEFRLTYLNVRFLDYKSIMKTDYMRYNDPKDWDTFTPYEPDISYYALLKYFNLNDPQYLYNATYSEVLQILLSNKTLNIPAIKDIPAEDWLKEVKTIMADLIGSDTGIFYDLLTANAYVRQFNNETKPLSDKQKENIIKYFKNEELIKILLKKNEDIVKLDEERQSIISNINATPEVPREALMSTILSRYEGKVVIVDFWATWCMPCLEAMKANREVKDMMKDKNIVFVYITDVTSPRELWKEKIKMIGGEHYYLTREELEYIMESFGFTGIPTYLFYDAKGIMKNKITGYPGVEKMKEMTDKLLL